MSFFVSSCGCAIFFCVFGIEGLGRLVSFGFCKIFFIRNKRFVDIGDCYFKKGLLSSPTLALPALQTLPFLSGS
jgi:hypothetical protein